MLGLNCEKIRIYLYKFVFFNSIIWLSNYKKKTDKIVEKENAELSQYIGKTLDNLKIGLGKPDEDFRNDKDNFELVYNTKKYGILCERRFEVDANSIVIGFVSKGCF